MTRWTHLLEEALQEHKNHETTANRKTLWIHSPSNPSIFLIMTDALEQRIAALEQGATFQATQTAIREREAEMLNTLREIREQMAKEAASGATASSGEVTELKQENARLQALVTKQEYRIRHLISNMEEMMAKK